MWVGGRVCCRGLSSLTQYKQGIVAKPPPLCHRSRYVFYFHLLVVCAELYILFQICFTFGTNACRAPERRGPFQNAAHFSRHKRRIAAQLPHGTLSAFPIPCIWLSEQRTDQKRRREGLSRHFYLPLIFCVFVRKRQSEGCVALLNSAKKKSYAFVIHYTWEESRFNLKLEESGAIINKPDPRALCFQPTQK